MGELVAVLTPIALLDSTSIIPLAIVPLAVLLGGRRPLLGSSAYLLGTFVTYSASGLAVAFGLSGVFAALGAYFERVLTDPDTLDLLLQIAIGLAMLALFWWIGGSARATGSRREASESMTPTRAFGLAAALTLIGMPGAFPYLAAIDQILRADPDPRGVVAAILYYNAIFVAPLAALVAVRVIAPRRSQEVLAHVRDIVGTWGPRVVRGIFLVLGLLLVADGVAYLAGHPILPT